MGEPVYGSMYTPSIIRTLRERARSATDEDLEAFGNAAWAAMPDLLAAARRCQELEQEVARLRLQVAALATRQPR